MRALVTGASGFLGGAIAQHLHTAGHEVRALQRSYDEALAALGIDQFCAPLSDRKTVELAARSCDVVFHVAAKAGFWGEREDFVAANVVGTENVIDACRAGGVRTLVYTSTPSVVHRGSDLEGVDESAPYADHFSAFYPETKKRAEQMVLAADDANLATVALRPHLIWGPGDNHLLPRLAERARSGRLRFVEEGEKHIDTCFIDNAVDAHIAAWEHMDAAHGRAYFITQGEPRPQRAIINDLLATEGIPSVNRSISLGMARRLGALCEPLWRYAPLSGEPPMTRFLAEQLGTAHWFDIGAARRDLGYGPRISFRAGLEEMASR